MRILLPAFRLFRSMAVHISPRSYFLAVSGILKNSLSKPPPDAPILPGWSRDNGLPVSLCIHVARIISEVHRGSPMLTKVSLGFTESEPVGQFATQKK